MIILKAHYDARGIRITPRTQEPNDLKELVAYDLRVGARYQEPGDATIRAFPKNTYTLKPGKSIVVYTLENVTMPHDTFGILCSKASLTAKGLIVANTKIDPGFDDFLKISVFNAGGRPVKIDQNKAFCSVVFHTLEHPVSIDASRKPPEIPGEHRSWPSRLWGAASSHPLFIAILAALISLAGNIVYNDYKERKEAQKTQQPQNPQEATNKDQKQ